MSGAQLKSHTDADRIEISIKNIARYGTPMARAEELGHNDIARFLTTNLNNNEGVALI